MGLGALVYAAIVVVDPFDTLWISPPLPRAPIEENQRYSYPALARSDRFDSVVIGTSTSRLLEPRVLDRLFEARFANLALNAGTTWEQDQMLRLFLRHHAHPKVVVIGVDDERWLREGREEERTAREYAFPAWLFDEDPWNDFTHLFDLWTLERARRQVSYLVGKRVASFGRDGYRSYLSDFGAYDPVRAAKHLYDDRAPTAPAGDPAEGALDAAARARLVYPNLPRLAALLDAIPRETEVVLYLPPYHRTRLPAVGSRAFARVAEGKARLAAVARGRPGTRVVDFMFPSPLTTVDGNYWDGVHTREAVADRVADVLRASRDAAARSDVYVLLAP